MGFGRRYTARELDEAQKGVIPGVSTRRGRELREGRQKKKAWGYVKQR